MGRDEFIEHMMLGIPADDADHLVIADALRRGDEIGQVLWMPECTRHPDTREFLSTVFDPQWQAEALYAPVR